MLAKVQDRDNVGMIQVRQSFGFPFETPTEALL